jgi:hypothetical protein
MHSSFNDYELSISCSETKNKTTNSNNSQGNSPHSDKCTHTLNTLLENVKISDSKSGINQNLAKALDEIDSIITIFKENYQNRINKIKDHFSHLSNQIQLDSKNSNIALIEILGELQIYEMRCLTNINTNPIQVNNVQQLFSNKSKLLKIWKNFLHSEITHPEVKLEIYNSALTTKQLLLNSAKFFNSLLFLGQLPVYEYDKVTNKKQLKYNEFTYIDILNTDRLNINYKPGKIVYNSLAFTPNYQILKTMWMSLIHVDRIVICLQVFNQLTCLNEIIIKYFDNNGHLINENLEHENCEVLSMITSEKFIIIAIEYFDKNHNFGKKYSIKLFDLNLNLSNLISIDYKPVLVYRTFCQIYIVTNKAPFIHVFDLSLEEKNSFGQDLDSSEPFYMPNVTQIYVRNEKLYVRDYENIFIKVLDLNKGNLIKIININLLDCLLHIDSIGRIIVINQDSKILYIFDESSKILFEYDLTFIQNITSFCITDNGHLLINDAQNKDLHVI